MSAKPVVETNQFKLTLGAVSLGVQAKLPLLLVGQPGEGKSDFAASLAKLMKWHFELITVNDREPSDFSGAPTSKNGEFEYSLMPWMRRVLQADDSLICLDDIGTTPPAVQVCLLKPIQSRRFGDEHPLPDGARFLAATNPPEDYSGGGWSLVSALANRMFHLPWELDEEAWGEWMDGSGDWFADPVIAPKNWQDFESGSRKLIRAFIRKHRTKLRRIVGKDKAETDSSSAYPSPRTWTKAATALAISRATYGDGPGGRPPDVGVMLMSAAVGAPAVKEFLGWLKELDMPDPEDILKDPTKWKLQSDGRDDRDWATLTYALDAVRNNCTYERWEAAAELVRYCYKQGKRALAAVHASGVAGMSDIVKKGKSGRLPPKALQEFGEFLQQVNKWRESAA